MDKTTGKTDKPATLKDVAKEAGVSMMAVSKVLNKKGGISKETSERILKAAKKLKYNANSIARSLRVSKTYTLGVVASDSADVVLTRVLRGIQDTAAEAEYSVFISNSNQDEKLERKAVETLLRKRIDGMILVAPLLTGASNMQYIKEFGMPLVVLMRKAGMVGVDSVVNDNIRGGFEIVDYLLNKGNEKIAFVGLKSQSGMEREQGYRDALARHGMCLDDDKILRCGPQIEEGYQNMKTLMSRGMGFDAVCCGCDMIAVGVMKALKERGVRIPEDVRVTGYDDIELADYLSVPLTTMSQPKYEIGKEGVRMLLERIDEPDGMPKQIILQSRLVIRESA
ncbi:LacI family transcriptional regulator [Christensenellaceae bacterium OttesenSCG-928-K19]|nr:LacI family transcriptional regulator [Christensenellaceae bacterium OttesenSCG-928-K19]